MKLLLDTHCLIWLLTDAAQLDDAARSVIADAEGVWFSEASIWELGLKWRKGRIAVQPRRLAEQALANGLRPLTIQMEALLVSCELRQTHGDPFDRLLYAQARHGGYQLLSIDRTLAGFGARVVSPKSR
ncbi:MAG: type II toxin-antitoxin system VapC family toxin [Panacagrimonas sp.]